MQGRLPDANQFSMIFPIKLHFGNSLQNIDKFLKLCFEIIFDAMAKANVKLSVNEMTQKYSKNIRAIVQEDARFEVRGEKDIYSTKAIVFLVLFL